MKKRLGSLLALICLITLTGCASVPLPIPSTSAPAEQTPLAETSSPSAASQPDTTLLPDTTESPEEPNILIAYFSVPENVETESVDAVSGASVVVRENQKLGSTQYVAQLIHDVVGGDMFRIEAEEEYPGEHKALTDYAAEEQAQQSRPPLAGHLEDVSSYDYIFLGYPIWWGDLPQPLYTFLEEYNFDGKTIIPFITHGGSAAADTLQTIATLQPQANILEETLVINREDLSTSDGSIMEWTQSLGHNTSSTLGEIQDTILNAQVDPGAS